jgi:hypothetical protein
MILGWREMDSCGLLNLPRLRFQTKFGSGAPDGFPFTLSVLEAPPRVLPDLATSFRREADDVAVGCGVVEVDPAADSGRDVALVALLDARNVRFTETDLKLWGFLTVDEDRACPFSPASFAVSVLDASVSEPPLTLASAELTSSSIISVICLFSISSADPFTTMLDRSTFWESGSVVVGWF